MCVWHFLHWHVLVAKYKVCNLPDIGILKRSDILKVEYSDPYGIWKNSSISWPLLIFKFHRYRSNSHTFYVPLLILTVSSVLRFIERYDPNIPAPESGNMRDIPKWRSQKAIWVPFIVSLDMSVWTVLQDVLTADSGKELCLQKTPTRDEPEQNITP